MSLSLKYSTGLPVKEDEISYMKRAISYGYKFTVRALRRKHKKKITDSGACATVMLLRGNIIVTAHIGDSRAILG